MRVGGHQAGGLGHVADISPHLLPAPFMVLKQDTGRRTFG